MKNQNVAGLTASATLAINEHTNRLIAGGQDVIKFGLGQSPFPVPEPLVDALRRHAREKDYLPVAGLPALREAVATHTRLQIEGLDPQVEDVMVAPSSKELIFIAQLVFGGTTLIPNPSWVSYAPQARIVGRKFCQIDTLESERWMLTADALDKAATLTPEAKLLILNYPSNPTGSSFDVPELEGLARVCRKHRIVVISDEIYGLVDHDGHHCSLAEFYPEGTIVSGGLSKWCGAGGWRLGTFVFPKALSWMREAMCVVASETYTSVSAPVQFAAIEGFSSSPTLKAYLDASRDILGAVAKHCARELRNARMTLPAPTGGFYVFANFEHHRESLRAQGIDSAKQLCARALEEVGVAFLPGEVFGRPATELTARIAYVDFDGAAAIRAHAAGGVDELFVRSFAPRVVEGTSRLLAWLGR